MTTSLQKIKDKAEEELFELKKDGCDWKDETPLYKIKNKDFKI